MAPKSLWTPYDLIIYALFISPHVAPKSLWTTNDLILYVL